MRESNASKWGIVAAFFLWPAATCFAADSISVIQLAVTGMIVPGTGGTFTSFSAPTADRQVDSNTGEDVYFFEAQSSNGNSGVYAYDAYSNAWGLIADTTMTTPTGGTFASFSNLSSGFGEVGFIATDSNGVQGVYARGGYFPLTLIATPSASPVPGKTFGNIQSISMMGGVFYGQESGEIESDNGIYDFSWTYEDGVLYSYNTIFTQEADTSTTPPGATGPFTSFGPVSYKAVWYVSNVPGVGSTIRTVRATAGGLEGIYYGVIPINSLQRTSASLVKVIQAGDAISNTTGTYFTSFGDPIATSNEISFTAHYSTPSGDRQGIFAYGPYEDESDPPNFFVHELVAQGDVAPNSGGATFTSFSQLSDSSFNETFPANLSNGGEGLYVYTTWDSSLYYDFGPPPQVVKVVVTGDTLDGKTVDGIELAPDASNYYDMGYDESYYRNVGIGFKVDFTDGSEGLYYFLINLPEPASLSILALPAATLFRRRPRTQKPSET
ncbi:MAG TPA: hypothetical protein VG722_07015 [Tepidisphaeraceae bacterium]|nr:hypothetical protein [Tepidisphaeraceae bacterium]